VLILKIVKVLCFDTLLQVLIPKELEEESKGKAAGLSGCCPDQVEDSALRYRCRSQRLDWVPDASLPERYSTKNSRKVKRKSRPGTSSCLCKEPEDAVFPLLVEAMEDGVDDALDAEFIDEADYGARARELN
jgi:hypothetical protein